MADWILSDSEQLRDSLTKTQAKQIASLYKRVYNQAKKQFEAIPKDGSTSQRIQKQYLDKLIKQLESSYSSITKALEDTITTGAQGAAEAVVKDAAKFAKDIGFPIEGAYSFVPDDIVASLVSGKLYGGNWSLSSSIWGHIKKCQKDINTIVAEGIAANKSAYDIAKDLEKYVDPSAKKPWDWGKVYPGTNKEVDYNAQRLARTMISHAYQQSMERVCKNNPFVTGYVWQAGHSTRVCELCASRDGQFFKKGELPLDHPNGMCTFIASLDGSVKDISDRLAAWANGGKDPALDKWAKDMGWSGEKPKAQPKKTTTKTKKANTSSGLTKAQQKRAKEWDEAYDRVVEFAKSKGWEVNRAVKDILGNPPIGSKHRVTAGGPAPQVSKKEPIKHGNSALFNEKGMQRGAANSYISTKAKSYSSWLKQAIEDYTMFSDDMNGYLRGQHRDAEFKQQILNLSKGMTTGKEETVFRGFDSKILGISPMLSEQDIVSRLMGTTFRDKGFISTSLAKDVAEEFSQRGMDDYEAQLPAILALKVPANAKRLYIDSGLGEIVLDKGSSIKIQDVKLVDGVLHLAGEVVV